MQVKIEVISADPGSQRGVELKIDNQEDIHQGNLLLKKSNLVWCPGNTKPERGKPVSWNHLIEFFENDM